MVEIKDRIIELRLEKGLTQSELAKELKLSPSSIGMYEQGRRKPSYPLLEKISDYFNVDMDFLMGKSNTRKSFQLEKECKINLKELKEIKTLPSLELNKIKKHIEKKLKEGPISNFYFDTIIEDGLAVDIHKFKDKFYVLVFDPTGSKKEVKTYLLNSTPENLNPLKLHDSEKIILLCEKFFEDINISLKEKEQTINKIQELFYKAKFNIEKGTK